MDIDSMASLTVVLGCMGGAFSYLVLRPLNIAIDNLNNAVGELRRELLAVETRRHELEKKMVEIDARAKSNQHRLNQMERGRGNVGHE